MIYWSQPLLAVMKAVTRAVQKLKAHGTLRKIKDELFTYEEYGRVVGLKQWLEFDGRY